MIFNHLLTLMDIDIVFRGAKGTKPALPDKLICSRRKKICSLLSSGNVEATKELLDCARLDLEATDEQKLTPLHLACAYGQSECVR